MLIIYVNWIVSRYSFYKLCFNSIYIYFIIMYSFFLENLENSIFHVHFLEGCESKKGKIIFYFGGTNLDRADGAVMRRKLRKHVSRCRRRRTNIDGRTILSYVDDDFRTRTDGLAQGTRPSAPRFRNKLKGPRAAPTDDHPILLRTLGGWYVVTWGRRARGTVWRTDGRPVRGETDKQLFWQRTSKEGDGFKILVILYGFYYII